MRWPRPRHRLSRLHSPRRMHQQLRKRLRHTARARTLRPGPLAVPAWSWSFSPSLKPRPLPLHVLPVLFHHLQPHPVLASLMDRQGGSARCVGLNVCMEVATKSYMCLKSTRTQTQPCWYHIASSTLSTHSTCCMFSSARAVVAPKEANC